MRKTIILVVFMFFIIIPSNADNTKWYTYEDGMKAASSTDRPVILDFYADWCSPCIAMEEGTYPDSRVISEMNDFIAIKVDTQVRIDIESKYHINYYPTVVFLDPEGNEILRHIGYLGPEDMVKTIQESRGKLPVESPAFEALYLLSAIIFLNITRRILR